MTKEVLVGDKIVWSSVAHADKLALAKRDRLAIRRLLKDKHGHWRFGIADIGNLFAKCDDYARQIRSR